MKNKLLKLFSLLLFIFKLIFPRLTFAQTPTPLGPTSDPPCPNGICDTAFGPFPTSIGAFVGKVLTISLGVSGGIALLLIISSGYKLSVSQGNQEKAQEAKETLTSAVAGLFFIIFAVVILQIFGINVLSLDYIFNK